jgi:Putative transposase
MVVYAKPAFGGPERVLDYLGRYTHRIAISNSRLLKSEDEQVTFTYKDYKHEQKVKVMTLCADEFLRRFFLHVLPDGFQRIRHYGLLGDRHRAEHLARCRELLTVPIPIPPAAPDYRQQCQQLSGQDPLRYPQCKTGLMMRIAILVPAAR